MSAELTPYYEDCEEIAYSPASLVPADLLAIFGIPWLGEGLGEALMLSLASSPHDILPV